MTQDGRVVARQEIHANIPAFRVNGLAVSDDARTIWITATAPKRQGVVLRIPAFGAGDVTTSLVDAASQDAANGRSRTGAHIFAQQLRLEERLGPLFNVARARRHNNVSGNDIDGGMGATDETSCSASRTSMPHRSIRFWARRPGRAAALSDGARRSL